MNKDNIENNKGKDNEYSENRVLEESKLEPFKIIGVIFLIILCIAVPIIIILAGIILLIAISQNKNADILGGIRKAAEFATKSSHNSSNIRVNSTSIISEGVALTNSDCLSTISETVGETVKRRGYSEPFNVSPFIRNLPLNQHPSAEKLEYCFENGIILGDNQTFVNGYTKGMNLWKMIRSN